MASGDYSEGVDVIRLTQNGQNLFTQGKIAEAVKEFQKAHYHALRLNHTPTTETCAFNLASAYAADGNGRKALEHLKSLSQNFMDTLDKGELTFLYGLAEQNNDQTTKSVRIVEHYRSALKQLNRLQSNMHASLKKYILEQLCVLDRRNSVDVLHYMHQLADVYGYLKMPFERLRLMCERANLLFNIGEEDDAVAAAQSCLVVIKELQGKKVAHVEGEDDDLQETMGHCLEIADIADTSHHLVPILNDIGLLFTQLQDTEMAIVCFKKARQMLSNGDSDAKRNDAVLLQNIGAVYNFKIVYSQKDIPEAVSYHSMALKQYGKQKNVKSQGHCYLNKAFAESRRHDITATQEAYILALHKAEEKDDLRTQWQALEGLSTVACVNKDSRKAQEYLRHALKLVHQDVQDPTQTVACERILEKLLLVNKGKGFTREYKRTAGSGFEMLISDMGQSLGSTGRRSKSSDMDELDKKLTKRQKRELKIRRSGSLRQFPKVARGLAADTPDLTQRDSENEDSIASEKTLSSDDTSTSDTSEVASPEDTSKGQRSRPTTAVRKGDPSTPRPTVSSRMSMRRSQVPATMSPSMSRRQSQKGLKSTLLTTFSDEDEDETEALRKAYKQISREEKEDSDAEYDDNESTARSRTQTLSKPDSDSDSDDDDDDDDDDEEEEEEASLERTTMKSLRFQGSVDPSRKDDRVGEAEEESIEEKSDNHVDIYKVQPEKKQMTMHMIASKKRMSSRDRTIEKSLRFQSPVDTSDEEDEGRPGTNNKSQVTADVHQPQRSSPGNRQLKSKIIPPKQDITDSESETDSDSDMLSEEETEPAGQRPPLPTNSPPLTPSNTYEIPVSVKPVMKDNPVHESTGHYAEIDHGNTDSARKAGEMTNALAVINKQMYQGPNYFHSSDENETGKPHSEKSKSASEKSGAGETTRSFGESTVYETIRPPDSTRSDYVTSDSVRSGGQLDDSGHSADESDMETERGLSRAEKEKRMMMYHQQHKRELEEEAHQQQQESKGNKSGKSKTCVIS